MKYSEFSSFFKGFCNFLKSHNWLYNNSCTKSASPIPSEFGLFGNLTTFGGACGGARPACPPVPPRALPPAGHGRGHPPPGLQMAMEGPTVDYLRRHDVVATVEAGLRSLALEQPRNPFRDLVRRTPDTVQLLPPPLPTVVPSARPVPGWPTSHSARMCPFSFLVRAGAIAVALLSAA
jgi:hypothetical protein